MHQAGGQRPAFVLAGGGAAAAGRAGNVKRRAVPAGASPGQEVADLAGGGAGDQPVVDVGLAALLERPAAAGQPGGEVRGGADVVARQAAVMC